VANPPEPPSAGTPPAEPDVADLSDKVKARSQAEDKKGRLIANTRTPTDDEFNPSVKQVPAKDLADTMDPKHGINEDQAAQVRKLSNDDLTNFNREDPISGIQKDDGTLAQTGGHHRTAEIDRRVKSGELPPDTPVPVLVHD
jgi:hypothetical protein